MLFVILPRTANPEFLLFLFLIVYGALGYVIYTCASQLIHQKEDVYDRVNEEYGDCMLDVLEGLVKVEDSKAQMLIDLIADIQQKALKISECADGREGGDI
ncbi:MAG TPA: hypothetical protein VK541_12995 [Pedobacter sp.]|uniref:hypothetical protein n=1 Tax=Pedobacter sp. TaxID=1411316 RepID=UPI002B8F7BC4|nr:hypothetical protein [Pedobacter sp.]HMI03399.1 hypothetical protein [Pedobacter sp.]